MSALAEAVGLRDRAWKDQAALGIAIATLCAEGGDQLPGPLGAEIGRLALRVLTEAEHEGSLPEPQRELTRWEPYPVSY